MPSSNGPLKGTRNKLSNHPRERGMSPPQRAVERFEEGEKVHLRIDPSVADGRFHPRFNGHTGEVVGEQGRAFKVRIIDGGKEKVLITTSAHLVRQPRTE
jgi:large subunit ribosomal protein L21e